MSLKCVESVIDEVCVEPVPCTILNMGFFDRLTANQIVRESGSIRKCFDEMCDDFIVSDELRKLLLMEDSDNYCLFNEEEREEFLFKILKHIALGGPVNQVHYIIYYLYTLTVCTSNCLIDVFVIVLLISLCI